MNEKGRYDETKEEKSQCQRKQRISGMRGWSTVKWCREDGIMKTQKRPLDVVTEKSGKSSRDIFQRQPIPESG